MGPRFLRPRASGLGPRLRIVVLLFVALPAFASTDWRGDIAYLAAEVQRVHPRMRECGAASAFEGRAEGLAARADQLDDAEVTVGIQALLASAGDGHTLLFPFGLKKVPVMLWSFDDGLYVIDAADPKLNGRRVMCIGDLPSDEVLTRLAPYISHDNAQQLRWAAPFYATLPAFLEEIGAIRNRDSVSLTFDDRSSATLTPEPIDPEKLELKLVAPLGERVPRYLARRDEPFYAEELRSHVLYIAVNGMRDGAGRTLAQFGVESRKRLALYDRAIVDLRLNNGGEASRADELFRTLVAFDARGGKLVTLISRMTFSAAQTFAARIDQWTSTTFAGEPTGSRPNHIGNERPFKLPHSGLRGTIASGLNQPISAHDDREAIAPDLAVPGLAADYFAGRDPVLEAALKTFAESQPLKTENRGPRTQDRGR